MCTGVRSDINSQCVCVCVCVRAYVHWKGVRLDVYSVCTWGWGQIGCVQCVYMGLGSDQICKVCVRGAGVRSDLYSVCTWGWGQIGCVQCVYMGLGSDRMCIVCVNGEGVRSDVYSVCTWVRSDVYYSLTCNVTPRLKQSASLVLV